MSHSSYVTQPPGETIPEWCATTDSADSTSSSDSCCCRVVHLPLIHAPTSPIVAMTVMSRIPRSTVYSINAAPFSSLPSRRTRFQALDMIVLLHVGVYLSEPYSVNSC